jgi:hypothetical protein
VTSTALKTLVNHRSGVSLTMRSDGCLSAVKQTLPLVSQQA